MHSPNNRANARDAALPRSRALSRAGERAGLEQMRANRSHQCSSSAANCPSLVVLQASTWQPRRRRRPGFLDRSPRPRRPPASPRRRHGRVQGHRQGPRRGVSGLGGRRGVLLQERLGGRRGGAGAEGDVSVFESFLRPVRRLEARGRSQVCGAGIGGARGGGRLVRRQALPLPFWTSRLFRERRREKRRKEEKLACFFYFFFLFFFFSTLSLLKTQQK